MPDYSKPFATDPGFHTGKPEDQRHLAALEYIAAQLFHIRKALEQMDEKNPLFGPVPEFKLPD